MSIQAQRILVWWALAFILIFGLSYGFLIHLLPLPRATLTADEVALFYRQNSFEIRLGAVICSWVSAFMVPLAVVIGVQMARLEQGIPIWSILEICGGCLMSLFLVLPPMFWGIAAFSPERPHEITLFMHEFANLTLVTSDQFFIFQNVAIAYVALTQRIDSNSPFPRWMGYFTIWASFMFEAGALGFLSRTGPFAWNGLFVYWIPLIVFGTWFFVMAFMLLRALRHQSATAAG